MLLLAETHTPATGASGCLGRPPAPRPGTSLDEKPGFFLDIDTFARRAEAREIGRLLEDGERIDLDDAPERDGGVGGSYSPGGGR